ncbi:MAG: peptidase domain-containing ABC transporter [Bacteroidales bacterium]|jgi:ATP-binding cassette subfamily B protein|nr:peptidase domain-containing ABC transporter [Bacteroidales bacterium]
MFSFRQYDSQDCGPACIQIVALLYNWHLELEQIRKLCDFSALGTSIYDLSKAAEAFEFNTIITHIPFEALYEAPLPAIVWWKQNHFIVVERVKGNTVHVIDPSAGRMRFSRQEFEERWAVDENNKGYALLLQPTFEKPKRRKNSKESDFNTKYYLSYFRTFKKYYLIVGLILVTGVVLQFLLPFLSQTMIDQGIGMQNIQLINIILIAQLIIQLSQLISSIIRTWMYMHIGIRASLRTVSNFLLKLLRLPITFFSTRRIGDILQRIEDNKRIEHFITGVLTETLFGFITLLVFGIVLFIYNWKLFLVFFVGSIIYIIYILIFQQQRRKLDVALFEKNAESNSRLIEIVESAQEIKLSNLTQQKRWEWEKVQVEIFKYQKKTLAFTQTQSAGAFFINEVKNIILSYLAAVSVVSGKITFGEMVAVQFIIGQLNIPIYRLVDFFQQFIVANLSLNRLLQIFQIDNEQVVESMLPIMPEQKNIDIYNLSFSYAPKNNKALALDNVTMHIRANQVTAIVGESGSGKSTLLKLILKLYGEYNGRIKVGGILLNQLNDDWWRNQCSAVLQDSYIFSESILYNICLSDKPDYSRLIDAVEKVNIRRFIESLPAGYNTKIGKEGTGLSQGQKQRILMARALYKDAPVLLLDEATNALDARNERKILDNLNEFYKGKTVVVVAHRLSTVRNADMIYVLKKGKIVEFGNHGELIAREGTYYYLVKNQLELSKDS